MSTHDAFADRLRTLIPDHNTRGKDQRRKEVNITHHQTRVEILKNLDAEFDRLFSLDDDQDG